MSVTGNRMALVATNEYVVATKDDSRNRREYEARLRFETLLSDISAHFINLPAHDVDNAIEDAQRQVCECLDLDIPCSGKCHRTIPARCS